MPSLRQSILKVIVYFNLFKYPVTAEEIKRFLEQPFDDAAFDNALNDLVALNKVFTQRGFYLLANEQPLVQRRLDGNLAAEKEIMHARKVARRLYRVPFVRAVAISGSLSKNFADEHSDFDFFIVTAANRLWIARTLLFLYCRLTTFGSHRRKICMNYFVDEEALEIEEKNFYTAIEILTLLPCEGGETLNRFFASNRWCGNYFPNDSVKFTLPEIPRTVTKNFFEKLLLTKAGSVIEKKLLYFFSSRWKKLYQKNIVTQSGYRLGGAITSRHVCKHIPAFQHTILQKFEVGLQKANYHLANGANVENFQSLNTKPILN
ncbi:hypothetical protein [Foetidibacter luteolus]|uniref:hypothetical protein n=1 Tax=Foetidibacter luteolus TaxID=2608880 RepID=UPI00129A6EF0|nr:hypothetical protein [Foetidibacter luteolus]